MKDHSTSIFWGADTMANACCSFRGVGVAASAWMARYSGSDRDRRARSCVCMCIHVMIVSVFTFYIGIGGWQRPRGWQGTQVQTGTSGVLRV